MDYALTGINGFIGSHVAERLIAEGHRVHAYGRRLPHTARGLDIWRNCATRTLMDLEKAVPDFSQVERVIHLAADMGGVGYFTKHDFMPYIRNSRITFNVLEGIEKHRVERSFMAASACAYPTEVQRIEGHAPRLYETELETGQPDQMYGREKLMMLRLAERSKQDVRTGLLHTVYGVGQESQGERVKFPVSAVKKALQARSTGKVEIWGNGTQLRSYLYVTDAVTKIMQILEGPYEGAVNVGFQGAVSCEQIVELCCKLAGVNAYEIVYNNAEPSGVASRDCDNTKFDSLYGDRIEIGYSEGFSLLTEWLAK